MSHVDGGPCLGTVRALLIVVLFLQSENACCCVPLAIILLLYCTILMQLPFAAVLRVCCMYVVLRAAPLVAVDLLCGVSTSQEKPLLAQRTDSAYSCSRTKIVVVVVFCAVGLETDHGRASIAARSLSLVWASGRWYNWIARQVTLHISSF